MSLEIERCGTCGATYSAGMMHDCPTTEKWGQHTIHAKRLCAPPCPFHAPSDHPLKDATMAIRYDKQALVERICEHGVGHDDPDSVAYMQAQGHTWAGVHGCDGCCGGKMPKTMEPPLVPAAHDATLRTAASQLAYAQAEKGDISKETYQNIGGLKIVENGYPYDMVYKDNDMLLGQDGMDFWTFWVKLGQLIDDGKLDSYDQIILNSPSKQSQPQVKHVHVVRFKQREEFEL